MGFLRRLGIGGRSSPMPVPDWAAFMSGAEYARFRDIVTAWLTSHSVTWHEEGSGTIRARRQGQEGEGNLLGLLNLAQTCHAIAPPGWEEQVARHLGAILFDPITDREQSLDEIRDRLKVRVYPADYLDAILARPGEVGLQPVAWPVAPGITAMLTEDLPTAVRTIRREELVRWELADDEARAIGLENVRREDRPPDVEPSSDQAVGAFMGDSFFTTTWLMLLDELLPEVPPHGAVVAVPMRHVLVVEPIRGADIAGKIGPLLHLTHRLFADGPGSISPDLYWWRPGQPLLLLPSTPGKKPTFTLPEAFLALLERLAESAPG